MARWAPRRATWKYTQLPTLAGGAHVDGQGPFKGNISELVIWSRSILDASKERKVQRRRVSRGWEYTVYKRGSASILSLIGRMWTRQSRKVLRGLAEDVGPQHYKAATVLLPSGGGGPRI